MAGFAGDGSYDRVHNWVTDKANNIKITASRMDSEFDTMAAAFENCLTRDGQGTPTDNLPMATYRHTGVGEAQARTDYLTMAQSQDNRVVYLGTTSQTPSSGYVVSSSVNFTSYVEGMTFDVVIDATNNVSNPGININGIGLVDLCDRYGNILPPRSVRPGDLTRIQYDGSQFRTQSLANREGIVLQGQGRFQSTGTLSMSTYALWPRTITNATSSSTGEYQITFATQSVTVTPRTILINHRPQDPGAQVLFAVSLTITANALSFTLVNGSGTAAIPAGFSFIDIIGTQG